MRSIKKKFKIFLFLLILFKSQSHYLHQFFKFILAIALTYYAIEIL